jgi:hypothetical protein
MTFNMRKPVLFHLNGSLSPLLGILLSPLLVIQQIIHVIAIREFWHAVMQCLGAHSTTTTLRSGPTSSGNINLGETRFREMLRPKSARPLISRLSHAPNALHAPRTLGIGCQARSGSASERLTRPM